MHNELLKHEFTLRVAVLEPHSDLRTELQGGIVEVPLDEEILRVIEAVIERRAGKMKGLAQIRVLEVKQKNVGALV